MNFTSLGRHYLYYSAITGQIQRCDNKNARSCLTGQGLCSLNRSGGLRRRSGLHRHGPVVAQLRADELAELPRQLGVDDAPVLLAQAQIAVAQQVVHALLAVGEGHGGGVVGLPAVDVRLGLRPFVGLHGAQEAQQLVHILLGHIHPFKIRILGMDRHLDAADHPPRAGAGDGGLLISAAAEAEGKQDGQDECNGLSKHGSTSQESEAGAGQDSQILLIAFPAEKADHLESLDGGEGGGMVLPVHPDAVDLRLHGAPSFFQDRFIILLLTEKGTECRRT